VLGKVQGLDGQSWMLIAHDGIGVGYVRRADLRPLDQWSRVLSGAPPSFQRRVNLDFAPTLRDTVYASVPCRTLRVNEISFETCKGLDGKWRAS